MKAQTFMTLRIALLGAFLAAVLPLHAQQIADRIVAIVDKEIILESELTERVNFLAFQNRLDPTKSDLRSLVLNDMMAEKLLLAQAILDSVVISEDEVNRMLDEQIQRLVRQVGSEQRLEEMYGMPVSRLKRENRAEMRKVLLIQRVRQTRDASVSVSRREVEEFFEAYKDSLPPVPTEYELNHIVITPKEDTTIVTATRAKLAAVRDSILAGAEFAEMARRFSEDNTASNGGLLGWVRRGEFVPEFEAALFALQEGRISDVVKTQFGFHIIQLVERRGEQVLARHILLRIGRSVTSDSDAVNTLNDLRRRALEGESFAELAKKFSEDNDTKPFGGDLGRVPVEQIPPEVFPWIKNLKDGEISEPHPVTIDRMQKYQIVLVRRIIPEHAMNLADDFRFIERYAQMFKKNREFQNWIEDMKTKVYWEVRL